MGPDEKLRHSGPDEEKLWDLGPDEKLRHSGPGEEKLRITAAASLFQRREK